MKITSFDKNNKIIRDSKQINLFNLFQKNITYNDNIPFDVYIVPREYEMRLDRISYHIYGTTDYVEELMVVNDILNPYSIKEGQYIYYCSIENLKLLYVKDDMKTDIDENRQQLIQSQKTKKTQNSKNLSPTIKPDNLEQIKVSKDNRVQIINSFE